MDLAQLSGHLKRHLRPGVPKYVSLKDAFVDAIAAGTLQSGDKVPNEQELAAALPMSLGTIQRALRELANTGVVDRKPGHGSFIKGALSTGEMAHPFHCRFLSDDGQSYLPVFPEVLGRHLKAAAGGWQQALQSKKAIEITRRIRIADDFYVYSAFFVDADRVPVFATSSLRELAHSNFKDILFNACGQAVTSVDLMVKQEIAPPKVCEALQIDKGTATTRIRAIGHFPDSDPIYYQEIFIPATSRELHIVADSRARGFMDGY